MSADPLPTAACPPVTGCPDVPTLCAWIEAADRWPVQVLGPAQAPTAVAMWYPSHLQVASIHRAHGLDWLVMQVTFCARPKRKMAVLPLLAHANLQMEGGRWFRLARPVRLVCAHEVPAALLDREIFAATWERFRREVLSHGIELTLRTRAEAWLAVLAQKGLTPPRRRARRRAAVPAEVG